MPALTLMISGVDTRPRLDQLLHKLHLLWTIDGLVAADEVQGSLAGACASHIDVGASLEEDVKEREVLVPQGIEKRVHPLLVHCVNVRSFFEQGCNENGNLVIRVAFFLNQEWEETSKSEVESPKVGF